MLSRIIQFVIRQCWLESRTANHCPKSAGQTVFHVQGLHGAADAAALKAKLSVLVGVEELRCVTGTQNMTITHDPVQAPVELLLWVVRDTGRKATVLHRTVDGPRWRWPATLSLLLGVIVLLCHWIGMPRWMEVGALLVALTAVVWTFLPKKHNPLSE